MEGLLADAELVARELAKSPLAALCETGMERHGTFGIEESRALAARQRETSAAGLKKVFIIAADTFTVPAQQSLLKVLEEPAPGTYFIIIAPKIGSMLPTVRSRAIEAALAPERRSAPFAAEAETFASLPPARRIAFVKAFVQEHEDEDDSARLAAAGLSFVRALMKRLHKDRRADDAAALAACILAERHLLSKGASAKMLLENIALSLS